MKIGILTGGGDCPGLNAVIRAIVKKGDKYGFDILGIRSGWQGMIQGKIEPITINSVHGILPRGGTIIGTSRTNPFKKEEYVQKTFDNYKRFGIDAIIAIGGEDTLGVANKLNKMGLNIVGIPKTIDNDLACTDYTFGFDTAVTIATEAIDRLHTTAESHDRIMVLEVMGRHTGWIATIAGLAGGADCILIPEKPFNIDDICMLIKRRHEKGKSFSIVVVAEGVKPEEGTGFVVQDEKVDAFGHIRLGGISHTIAKEIEKKTGYETRVTILGHIQRGGTPTPFDRVLATRFGVAAVDLVKNGDFGKMVSLQGNKIVTVNLEEAVSALKTVDLSLFEIAEVFFG
ncbi:MAG: 6-phosphofructokinase [Nitrospinae bacterium]|nr:6-phosphofructokinase [Nitrospinota bacterium]